MDTTTPSNQQHSLLQSILWVLTMALIYVVIHHRFDAYLNPSGGESLHHARLRASIQRELEDIEEKLELAEAGSLELRQYIIQTHDRALSIFPELMEMHAAQCKLTPERRRIFVRAEESRSASGEKRDYGHQDVEGC